MDDPPVVRGRQPVAELGGVVEHLAQRQGHVAVARVTQLRPKRLAVEQLDHQVGDGRFRIGQHFTDVVEPTDMQMLELRDGSCLALESAFALRVHGKAGGQQLDRDVPIQAGVASAPHFTHTSRTDTRGELVRTQARTWRDGHREILLAASRRTTHHGADYRMRAQRLPPNHLQQGLGITCTMQFNL